MESSKNVVMRCMVMVGVSLFLVFQSRAQTFAEWFRQNSTRLKYYAKQIAALQAYYGQLREGTLIEDMGLGSIGGGKAGEYGLHNNYYTSLRQINPSLSRMSELAVIVTLQAGLVNRFTDALARYRKDGLLGKDMVGYVDGTYGAFLKAGLSDVVALADALMADKWQMSDDQRMVRIRGVCEAMRHRYCFAADFIDRMDVLERQLEGEHVVVGTGKAFYGVQ